MKLFQVTKRNTNTFVTVFPIDNKNMIGTHKAQVFINTLLFEDLNGWSLIGRYFSIYNEDLVQNVLGERASQLSRQFTNLKRYFKINVSSISSPEVHISEIFIWGINNIDIKEEYITVQAKHIKQIVDYEPANSLSLDLLTQVNDIYFSILKLISEVTEQLTSPLKPRGENGAIIINDSHSYLQI